MNVMVFLQEARDPGDSVATSLRVNTKCGHRVLCSTLLDLAAQAPNTGIELEDNNILEWLMKC